MTDPRLQMPAAQPEPTGAGEPGGIGPLLVAAFAVGGLGLLLVLISMPMALIKTVDQYRYDSSESFQTSTRTYDMFDLAHVLPLLALLVAGLLAVAALTRGRVHLAARIIGGITGLYTAVYVFGVWRSLARYTTEEADKDDRYHMHLLAGWYLALAGSLLLIAAVAMAHHLPPSRPPVAPPAAYPQQYQQPVPYQQPEYQPPGYPQQYGPQYPPG